MSHTGTFPPLEMTMAAGCIQSFQGTDDKTPPAPVISTKQSGVEKSHSSNDRNVTPPRHFDRSAAEWRNLTP